MKEKLKRLEMEINDIKNNDYYKKLYKRNIPWVDPTLTLEEKESWVELKAELDKLEELRSNYLDFIIAFNNAQVKTVRKGSKDDTASKNQRQLLTKIAIRLYALYDFPLRNQNVNFPINDKPTFGDVQAAVGFWTKRSIYDYFDNAKKVNPEKDYELKDGQTPLEDFFTRDEWLKRFAF